MKKVLIWVATIAFVVGMFFLDALMFQYCWNLVMPKIGPFGEINYWLSFAVSMFIGMITASVATKADEATTPHDLVTRSLGFIAVKAIALGLIALFSLGF